MMGIDFLRTATFKPSGTTDGRSQIAADIAEKYGTAGDLVDIFVQHRGEGVDKWHHYLPLYERYLGPWRNRPLRFLEIGVFKGGSLEMWRKYFGPEAVIFGIDIDPTCARFDGRDGQVRIGSQADPEFLSAVVDEMGGVDVVLDDGSHVMPHIRASLAALFPRMSSGGTYIIEDLHTAYWQQYGGGTASVTNFYTTVHAMIDDMHGWYHEAGIAHPPTAGQLTGIHIHDSMVVLEKGTAHRPVRSIVGVHTDMADNARNTLAEGKAS
jgi:cephalosporin hydroxylase